MLDLCSNCGCNRAGQGWSLRNYYGITGRFCQECYDKVNHDSYGNPEHPGEYIAILLKQKVPA
mgnify:CR=1 FL=1